MPRLLVASALFLTAVHAQDNTVQVPPGREIREHKLLSLGQTDVWKLDVKKDEMLWCIVDSGVFDPVLELYDNDNHRVAQDDGAGLRSELWLRMPADGPVEFRVHGFQGAGGGQYQFWLQRYATETLSAQGEASHQFGKELWWHWRVGLRKGDLLVPSVQGEGRLTAVFAAADRTGLGDFHGAFAAPRDGDYFVRVEGAEGRRCNVTTQLARRHELAVGRGAEDCAVPFGFDLWRLCLQAGRAYVIDVAMPEAQLEFDWRDLTPGGESSFACPGHLDKGGRRHFWLYARRDGALEMMLRNRGGEPAPYTISCALADRELAAGAAIAGNLALGDGHLYCLQASGGDLMRLRLCSKSFDARFDVWDPDGNVIAQAVDDLGPLDRDAEHTFLVSRPGCYRVLAYCNAGAGSGGYSLQASVLEVPELKQGASLPVKVPSGGTSHVHLRLQAGQEVWLSVRSQAFDAGLTVLAPDGNASFHCEGGGRGGDVLTAYVASHSGMHTLLVHSRGGAGDGEVRVIVP